MKKNYKCCICGKEQEGIGYQPYPYPAELRDRCCRKCKWVYVLPFNKLEKLHAEGYI